MPFKKLLFRKYPRLFRLLCTVSLLAISSTTIFAQSADGDVVVYMDSTAQLIRGFGAANIVGWRPDLTEQDIENAFGLGEGQLGFTILRLKIHPDKNQWSNSLPSAQKAHEMGAIIFASPWNAPPEMLDPEAEGDTVLYEMYDEYAAHLDDFNTYMEDNGVPLYAISIQNEPDYAHDWTGWSPEGMLKFMRENADDIGTRVMAPESFQFRKDMSDPILNDSLAKANLDIVGGHIYGGGLAPYPLAEEKGKEIWMTEYLLNKGATSNWSELGEEAIWDETMDMLRTMQQSMKNNWNAYVWWYLQRYYSFIGDGEQGTQRGEILKRGYAFSQFSRFIRPGYHRVYAKEPVGRGLLNVTATAYTDSASSKLVIVAVNGENGDRDINFVVDGADAQSFNQYRTSETQDVEELENIEATDNRFMTTLPANSITTFVSSDIVVSNERLVDAPGDYQLEQNYPNPFNPSTTIKYQLPASSDVSLKVYDMLGREVANLVNGRQAAGAHQARFDASSLSSGMYIYRLQAGSFVQTRKMMLIK